MRLLLWPMGCVVGPSSWVLVTNSLAPFGSASSPADQQWLQGVVLVHSLLLMACVYFLASFRSSVTGAVGPLRPRPRACIVSCFSSA